MKGLNTVVKWASVSTGQRQLLRAGAGQPIGLQSDEEMMRAFKAMS
jgi:hypothetical protein